MTSLCRKTDCSLTTKKLTEGREKAFPHRRNSGECPKIMTISDVIEILYQDMGDYSIPLSNGEIISIRTEKAETAWIIDGRQCSTYVEARIALTQTLYRKLVGADFMLHYSETMDAPDAITADLMPDGRRILNFANGEHIEVCSVPDGKHPGFDIRIDNQYFPRKDYADIYLASLVYEKLTGKRIITYAKREVPQICGINGAACRNKACTSALCNRCPVAEEHFAQMDRAELIYAVDWEELEV